MIRTENGFLISEDRRKWNTLVDWYWSSGWVVQSYSWTHHAWSEARMPSGWSRFGARKYEKDQYFDELNDLIIPSLKQWIERDNWSDPQRCGAIAFLKERGIVKDADKDAE